MADTRSHTESDAQSATAPPAPRLVLAFEYRRPVAPPLRVELADLQVVSIGRGPQRAVAATIEAGRRGVRIDVDDEWMSSDHARLWRSGRCWKVADRGSKNGLFVDGERVSEAALADGVRLEIGNTMFVFRCDAPGAVGAPLTLEGEVVVREPPALRTLSARHALELARLRRVASAPVSVLLLGPTGSGKELIARAVHELSGRSGRFVAVNCGALPATLIESQLFGYVRGAFSGADRDRAGLIRAAHGGTLFLDEVAELAPASQVALLRVLQQAEVVPVGGTEPVPVDLRVVAATHQRLRARMDQGSFREDLYARLAGMVFEVPPLVSRPEDLGLIVAELLRRAAGAGADEVRFHRSAGRALFHHHWPRNIRELEAALTSALAIAGGEAITLDHLPAEVGEAAARPPPSSRQGEDAALRVRIEAALAEQHGNVSAAARAMGLSRGHLHRLMQRLGIRSADHRDG